MSPTYRTAVENSCGSLSTEL